MPSTIAGAGMREYGFAKDADAGWPLGILRWNKTGELIIQRLPHARRLAHRPRRNPPPIRRHWHTWLLRRRRPLPSMHASTLRMTSPKTSMATSSSTTSTTPSIDASTPKPASSIPSSALGEVGRGGDGGPATEAEMDTHCGIAIADNGDIYISSEWANNIRRVDAQTGTHRPLRRTSSSPLPIRIGPQQTLLRARTWPRGIQRRWRPKGNRRLLPSRTPRLRLRGRSLRVRQLQRPHPKDRHGHWHRYHSPGQWDSAPPTVTAALRSKHPLSCRTPSASTTVTTSTSAKSTASASDESMPRQASSPPLREQACRAWAQKASPQPKPKSTPSKLESGPTPMAPSSTTTAEAGPDASTDKPASSPPCSEARPSTTANLRPTPF